MYRPDAAGSQFGSIQSFYGAMYDQGEFSSSQSAVQSVYNVPDVDGNIYSVRPVAEGQGRYDTLTRRAQIHQYLDVNGPNALMHYADSDAQYWSNMGDISAAGGQNLYFDLAPQDDMYFDLAPTADGPGYYSHSTDPEGPTYFIPVDTSDPTYALDAGQQGLYADVSA